MSTPILERLQELYAEIGWSRDAKTQGDYFHWNGDEDCAPVILSVLYSGTTGNCFVSIGQKGITHPVDTAEYGGWWMPIFDPKIPLEQQREAEEEMRMHEAMETPKKRRANPAAAGEK